MSGERKSEPQRTKRKIATAAKLQTVESHMKKALTSRIDPLDMPRVVSGVGIAELIAEHKEPAERPMMVPPEYRTLEKALQKLGPVQLCVELGKGQPSQAEILEAIGSARAYLPLMTAEQESQQLGEAGRFGDRVYPACKFGAKCVGVTAGIRVMHRTKKTSSSEPPPAPPSSSTAVARVAPCRAELALHDDDEDDVTEIAPETKDEKSFQGAVLQAHMTPSAYEYFMKTGKAPDESSPCIACYRCNVMDVVLARRGNPEGARLAADVAYQAWRVVPNGEGNYDSSQVFTRQPGVNDGLRDTFVKWRPGLLFWERSEPHGRWMINQSALMWRAPSDTAPAVGEALQDF